MGTSYIPRSDDAFRRWVQQFLAAAATQTTALHITTADITRMTTEFNAFDAALTVTTAQEAAFHAGVNAKNTKRSTVENDIRNVVRLIQGYSDVSEALKIQLGLNPHTGDRTHGEPAAPNQLMATPFANGVNELFWNRSGNKPTTIFVIEAMIGNAAEFVQVGSTGTTRFRHTGQTPGVHVVYRIIAQRDGMESLPSLTASVYEPASGTESVALQLAA